MSTHQVSKVLWSIRLLSVVYDAAKAYLKCGQTAEFFYCFLFKMRLIGAYPPWKIINAITLTLITTVTFSCQLGWKHCKAGKPAPFSTGGPHPAETSDFLGFQGPCRWHGLLGRCQPPVHWLPLPLGVYGRVVCAAWILGSLQGFSKPLSGQWAGKSRVVVNEVNEALCG